MELKEDYVSLEIAKLLKERGFDCECIGYYVDYEPNDVHYSFCGETNSTWESRCCSAPTIQMTMKWLREVHKWSIQVFPVFDNLKWCYDIYELKKQKYHSRPDLMSNKDYDTYEQAAEAAIKYCLTNLI